MGSIDTLAFIGTAEKKGEAAKSTPRIATETETSYGHVLPSAPAHIEGAIFDLDGTLLDSMPWWDDLGERYLRNLGKTPNPDIRYHFKRLTMEGSAEYMKETYHLEQSIEEICQGVMEGIDSAYRESIPCKPGVEHMLQALQNAGVPTCVATASPRNVAMAALERLDILKFLSAVFTCTEVGASKTEPTIFEVALDHLGTPRKSTVVFEDSLHAIETAHAAGFPTAAIQEAASIDDRERILEIADISIVDFSAFLQS